MPTAPCLPYLSLGQPAHYSCAACRPQHPNYAGNLAFWTGPTSFSLPFLGLPLPLLNVPNQIDAIQVGSGRG